MQQKTYDIVYTGMFAVLLAICSWISIPTLIPFTLQTFGVFLTLFVLGGKRGTGVIALYLLLGAIGIPVFSHFGAGLGYLLGNTGGYALGFLFPGFFVWAFEKLPGKKSILSICSMILGLAACYIFGTFWFMKISIASKTSMELTSVFSMCVIPFILPDCIKLFLAYLISKRLRPILRTTAS